MKNRLPLLSLVAVVKELQQTAVHMKVQNIYNTTTSRTLLFKLQAKGKKVMLLLESGVRLHTTSFDRPKPPMPSQFVMKLRKHVRGRYLNSIVLLGVDRVVDMRFGMGDRTCHVLLELYAGGNIVLTDSEYKILSLVRTAEDAEGLTWRVGQSYPVNASNRGASLRLLAESLPIVAVVEGGAEREAAPAGGSDSEEAEAADGAAGAGSAPAELSLDPALQEEELAAHLEAVLRPLERRPRPRRKQRGRFTLRAALITPGSGLDAYGPQLVDHAIAAAGLAPNALVCEGSAAPSPAELAALATSIRQLPGLVHEAATGDAEGFVFVKSKAGDPPLAEGEVKVVAPLAVLRGETPQQAAADIGDLSDGDDDGNDDGDDDDDGGDDGEGGTGEEKDGEGAQDGGAAAGSGAQVESLDQRADGVLDEYAAASVTGCLLAQHRAAKPSWVRFPSLNEALDSFFAQDEAARLDRRVNDAEKVAQSKVDKIKRDHQRRLAQLQHQQELTQRKAGAIEAALQLVDGAITVVRSALDSGLDWSELERLVRAETDKGNPVASLICGLDLARQRITLRLRDWEVDIPEGFQAPAPGLSGGGASEGAAAGAGGGDVDDDDEEESPFLEVSIDVTQSAAANASVYYQSGKAARSKEHRTAEHGQVAVVAAERRARKEVDRAHRQTMGTQQTVAMARKPAWFEKFLWFISTDGVVVVAGKDAQQNELLVKRYLRPQDLYVHSEQAGSATVVVRSPKDAAEPKGAGIPPATIEQAGAFAVCRSSAWVANRAMSAYWVFADQVSKAAPTGEFLPTGSFMVRGRKNQLPPAKVELGLGLMFKLDPDGAAQRLAASRRRAALAASAAAPVAAPTPSPAPLAALAAGGGSSGAAKPGVQFMMTADVGAFVQDDEEDDEDEDEGPPQQTAQAPAAGGGGAAGDDEEDEDEDDDDDNDDDDEDEDDDGKEGGGASKRRGVSKAVRRRARKYMQRDGLDWEAALAKAEAVAPASRPELEQDEAEEKEGQPERRRRTRAQKRRAAKYADQDEEDRALAMRALGHDVELPSERRQRQERERAEAGEASDEGQEDEEDEERERVMDVGGTGMRVRVAASGLSDVASTVAGAGGLLHLGHTAEPTGALGEALLIAGLVEEPQPEEVLLHCIPMVAPYAVVSSFKYRAKLVPSSGGKRGKVGKAAMHDLVGFASRKGTQREVQLMRGMADTELSAQMPSDAKMAGNSAGSSSGGKGRKGGGKGGSKKGGRRRAAGANKRAQRKG